VQYDEYLAYSAGYRWRVCVDISFRALVEARKKLGANGLYVLADVSNLPFRDNTFDAVVSLHTIYHVPKDEQETAFRELFRVLAPSRRGVIVYSWGIHAFLTKLAVLPVWGWRMIVQRTRRRFGAGIDHPSGRTPRLYSYHHSYRWLATRVWPVAYELYCWRSVGVEFTKLYCHSWFFGESFLRFLFRLEDRWPRLFGIIGQYPMIVFAKAPAPAYPRVRDPAATRD
jgi:ubiquinone/menaquinone biosynthesis C-methylase UbiE